ASDCGKNFQGSVGETFTAMWEKLLHPQRLTVGKTSQRCGKNVHSSVGENPTPPASNCGKNFPKVWEKFPRKRKELLKE
ncbi:hypothetical protein, partial [Sedimentisphaera salicampi]|uniref:hypothetical protein n=1 Tax=Sedimentisphaera salicampi TaxID=1941349 RepID=UPI001956F5B4